MTCVVDDNGSFLLALLESFLFFLIVTIPFGISSFRLANFALWPNGRTVVPDPETGAGSMIGNVL